MKTKILIILTVLLILTTSSLFIINRHSNHLYGLTTVVVNVSEANDRVTCEDFNGNLWQFEGIEDWNENDIATLIMDNNGTDLIKDDIIVSVRYDGFFDGWLEDSE